MTVKDEENQLESGNLELPDNNFYIFVGANNSGKSTILRSIHKSRFATSYMISVNRTILKGEGAINKGYQQGYISFMKDTQNAQDDNTETRLQTLQDFFGLNDSERQP